MDAPLAVFVKGLISGKNLASGPAQVEIVQDNCGKLSQRARKLVRLAYCGSRPADGCRWDSCKSRGDSPKQKSLNDSNSAALLPNRPARRASLEPGADVWKPRSPSKSGDTIPNLPPRDLAARSSLRWALALDGKGRKINFYPSSEDDDDASTDSETESSYSESELDFDDYETDSDSDSDYDEDDDYGWSGSHKVNAHEWTFAPNTILPNMQELFRKAAQNKDFDINKTVQAMSCSAPRTGPCH